MISSTHLVLIPTYNAGPRLERTVREALDYWSPVWVVVDGSTDASAAPIRALAAEDPRVRVLERPRNGGKGAAVQTGIEAALAEGFSHVLVMDSDGQHAASEIAGFMAASHANPGAVVFGRPVFGPEAPLKRLYGRRLSNALVRLETLGRGVDDCLFGFRVYPAAALARVLDATRYARGFDFDPEVAVRLFWAGVPAVNRPAPCRYLSKAEGGVSHFRYFRDNLKMIGLHARLLAELVTGRWGDVLRARRAGAAARAARLVLFWVLAAGAAVVGMRAADGTRTPEPPVIADAAHDPAWSGLLARLAPDKTRESTFEERRYFPFRRDPVVLAGKIRIVPGRGLSLDYLAPERRIVIADSQGLVFRDADGRDRRPPADARARAATTALVDVLRFDLPELQRRFVMRGVRQGDAWTLSFDARDPALSAVLGSLVLSGDGGGLRRIEMARSARQRIEILIGVTREGVSFTPETLARFFR